jgi:WD40 repeat protein
LLRSISVATVNGRSVIVSGGEDSVIRVWDINSGEEREESALYGHNSEVISVTFNSFKNGPTLISAERRGGMRTWNVASGKCCVGPVGAQRPVTALVAGTLFNRPTIISGDADGTVCLWDGVSGAQRGHHLSEHEGKITSVMLADLHTGPTIVSSGVDGTIRLWDVCRSSIFFLYRLYVARRGKPLLGHRGAITSTSVGSFNGRPVVISGGDDHTVRIWDLTCGDEIVEPLLGHNSPVTAVTLGLFAGQEVIISGAQDGTVRICDQDGITLSTIQIGCSIRCMAFANPQSLVVATDKGFLLFKF